MYKVLKSVGSGANVSVENTETKSSVIVGKLNTDVVDIITAYKGCGYVIPEYDSIWDIEVSSDCAKALLNLTMKIKKPIRNQSKKSKVVVNTDEEVDAFDLIFGEV